jgi:poly(A) polymerase
MDHPFEKAYSICKTIMRNGHEAYIINPRLQEAILRAREGEQPCVDVATDMSFDEVVRLFSTAKPVRDPEVIASVTEDGVLIHFHLADTFEGSHPEVTVALDTPRMRMASAELAQSLDPVGRTYSPEPGNEHDGFVDFSSGQVRFLGLASETIKRNYLLGIRAMRFAANYQLPIGPNTWMAIVRSTQRILDYVPVTDIMDEWSRVEAENMWHFVKLLNSSQVLHGLLPEVAAMSRVSETGENGAEITALDHTIEVMRHYPEELPYDWYGTLACLFHDVGKLYTAEYFEGSWVHFQHHLVGAKVTRKILGRLRMSPADIDLVCDLVRHHMRFHFMLTDRGARRFKALPEYPRLIEMARADIKARGGQYAYFNHNLKIMERADTPEEMLEPLLNGNEIMDFTGLKPGPVVGRIRESLLQAQVAGEVSSIPEAVDFVRRYQVQAAG